MKLLAHSFCFLAVTAMLGSMAIASGDTGKVDAIASGDTGKVDAEEIRFNRQIRPILADHCFGCHGPDTASRKADLRLDTEEGAIGSGLIVPGNASDSDLIQRILSRDADYQMPPPDAHKQLGLHQKQLLADWVNEGAKWENHWSFIPPRRPKLPVSDGVDQWARNPIDYFVLAQLSRLGLKPNESANKATLARRAALDLLGLPPTDEQLNLYLDDDRDDAFGHYVDRLLQSPHAGEHRARYWLDAARYGDTHGMHVDNYREIWPYRDWVINAFHRNMPFDQFVFEQIAGDLIPNATLEQQIATGFNRCNITTSEGGAIPEELDVRYMVDRVETTATVLLGLTAGCAVCHDHKYDPITQREFYQLGAFFNNTTQPAMDGNQKDTPPVAVLPNEEFTEEWNTLQAARRSLRAELDAITSTAEASWPERDRTPAHPVGDDDLVLFVPMSPDHDWPSLPDQARWSEDHPGGRRGIRVQEKADWTTEFPQLRSDQPFTVSFWFRTPEILAGTTILDQTSKVDDKTLGWKITSGSANNLNFSMMGGGKSISGNLPDNEALKPNQWQHVCVRYSGGQSTSSISIFADGKRIALRNASEGLIDAVALADTPLKIATQLPTAGLSDLRIFTRWLSDEEVTLLANEWRLRDRLQSDLVWSELTARDQALFSSYRRQQYDDTYRSRSRELSTTSTRWDYIYSRSTTTLVMQERDESPGAWVLERGEYTKPLEQVTPDVPAVLPPLPTHAPANRLALAEWLTDQRHPLVSRVVVNRLWQSVFGTGLVKTAEDFGVMGERPLLPELLDWLAVEFVDSGWNINHMIRLMVTSAAYRQHSSVTPEKLAADPENRYLSRGPRYRLDAELLRDQALAVGGLLQRDVGGPSVKPYQPDGLWNVVAITGSNTRFFKRDEGAALYRRSMYTFWKRTSPPPAMAAFNAPTREQCTVRRERTNTPLQALVMMNDVQFVEAARSLAQTLLLSCKDDHERASDAVWRALRRRARDTEIRELVEMARAFHAEFEDAPESAQKLLSTGDTPVDEHVEPIQLAAWTMVTTTLMNRDDFINK